MRRNFLLYKQFAWEIYRYALTFIDSILAKISDNCLNTWQFLFQTLIRTKAKLWNKYTYVSQFLTLFNRGWERNSIQFPIPTKFSQFDVFLLQHCFMNSGTKLFPILTITSSILRTFSKSSSNNQLHLILSWQVWQWVSMNPLNGQTPGQANVLLSSSWCLENQAKIPVTFIWPTSQVKWVFLLQNT